MPEEPQQFDDPGLKAAICRAWGAERCPHELRLRVLAGRRPAPAGARQPLVIPMRPFVGLATAALVLIAATLAWQEWQGGIGPNSLSRTNSPIDTTPAVSSLPGSLPASLADNLAYRHDACSASPDHRDPDLAQSNPAELARQMQDVLNFPVLTGPLHDGWAFRGAAFCRVGSRRSAHLLFFRPEAPAATVSVFSLPADVWPGGQGRTCAELAAGSHAIAGFATSKGFYAVVGSAHPPIPLPQVRQILDRLRPELVDNGNPNDQPIPDTVSVSNDGR